MPCNPEVEVRNAKAKRHPNALRLLLRSVARSLHRVLQMPDAKGRALSASICLVAGSTSGTVWWTRLPMNRTPSSRPSPPVGEKVPGGRLRGIPTGSWPRCVILKSWRLSMNLVGRASSRALISIHWIRARRSLAPPFMAPTHVHFWRSVLSLLVWLSRVGFRRSEP